MKRFLSAREVCAALGISAGTLYSYVSRGLIRSQMVDSSRRERQYSAEDVSYLISKRQGRRDPEKAAREVLGWGLPVMESALTLITEDGLYYRGEDALRLAQTGTFEETARILWGVGEALEDVQYRNSHDHWLEVPPIPRMIEALIHVSIAWDNTQDKAAQGWLILHSLTDALVKMTGHSGHIMARIADGWGVGTAESRLIEAALILCADHELNSSAFAVRVAASTNAPLPAALIAGLATLSGEKHGGAVSNALAFLDSIETKNDVAASVKKYAELNGEVAGFGHRLYPIGDPRGYVLLEMMRHELPDNKVIHLAKAVMRTVYDQLGVYPNIDFALAVLVRACQLPSESGVGIFALGRAAGWIAHVWEQYEVGRLIRPRARYIGVEKNNLINQAE